MADGLTILSSSIALHSPTPSPQPHPHLHPPFTGKTKLKSIAKPVSKSTKLPSVSTSQSNSISRRANNLDYYAELASKFIEEGSTEDFLILAENIAVLNVPLSQFAASINVKVISAGINRIVNEGRLTSAASLLNGVRKLGFRATEGFDGVTTEEIQRECRRSLESGEVEAILSFLEALQGVGFPVRGLVEPSDVIKLCTKKRNPSAAIRFARIFPHVDILLCTIILEFGRKRDLVSALTVFEASQEILDNHNMYVYRTIIDVCGLCGAYMKSRSIYEGLIVRKITPNVYVFNSLMNVNASDLSYTLHIYKQMQNLGVTADMTSYNILLKSCSRAARLDVAQEIYGELQHLELTGAIKLDVFTYSTIIKVFADAKLWKMALKIKEDMLSAGVTPNIVTWSSLIKACATTGLVEEATQILKEMLMVGCEPNSQCCNTLLHACVEARQYDRAFRLFRSWKESGFQDVFIEYGKMDNCIGAGSKPENCNCSSRSHQSAFPVTVPFEPTVSTYNILMKACGTDYHRAKAMMDEMKTMGLSPNHISWSILIDICGGSGNIDGALQVLRSMVKAGIQPDVISYTTAIKRCVECKKPKLAFSLFEEMKKYQIKPNIVTYNTLLRARNRYGSLQEVQQCLAVYQDMRKAGCKANNYYLKQLIEEWCEGVIQDDQKKRKLSSHRIDLRAHNLLLEKVAEHLQRSTIQSLSIDLQGLTKVEARIVVLAVLRMIKEKYAQGDSIKDDVLIILGAQEFGANATNYQNGVKEAVIKLLQFDLGLEVPSAGPRTENDGKSQKENSVEPQLHPEEVTVRSTLLSESESQIRRPATVETLCVTKESLCDWLLKRAEQ